MKKIQDPNKFELQLDQLKTELKTALTSDDRTRVKDLQRYIRNLEAIVNKLKKK